MRLDCLNTATKWQVVTALGTVMLPHMTESMSCSSNGKESESLLQSSFEIMQFISLGLAFGIVAVAKPIADIYFGPGFGKCSIVLPIVAIMIPIIAASNVLGVQYMLPKNMDKQYTKSNCKYITVLFAIKTVWLHWCWNRHCSHGTNRLVCSGLLRKKAA